MRFMLKQARQENSRPIENIRKNDTELREVARATTFRHQIQRMRPGSSRPPPGNRSTGGRLKPRKAPP